MKKLIVFIICSVLFLPKSFAGFWEDLDAQARSKAFPDEYNYNTWVESYNKEEYLDAIEHFMSVDCEEKNTELCFNTYYNLGNSLYYFSYEVADDVKVKNYEKAIKNYEEALKIKEDDIETEKNKKFVEDKLKRLKEKLDKQKIKQKQNNKSWWDWESKSWKNHSQKWENDGLKNNKQKPKPNKNQSEESAPLEEVPDYVNESRIGQELTDNEKESMKQRLDYLKKDSQINANAFDKKRDPNAEIRSKMFWDFESQFWIGIQRNEQKDW